VMMMKKMKMVKKREAHRSKMNKDLLKERDLNT
jgi:hypothetical protein